MSEKHRNGKKIAYALIIFISFYLCVAHALFCLALANPEHNDNKIADEIFKTCEEEKNYKRFYGEILTYRKSDQLCYLMFNNLSSDDTDVDLNVVQNPVFKIYSLDYETTWSFLNPSVGMILSFICCPYVKQSKLLIPIVQISVNNIEILSFKDGKTALMNYIQTFR